VEVHLADLQRPLYDRVQILLLDLSVGAQAEVVRQLADVLLAVPRVDHVAKQAIAGLASPVEVLEVDALDELLVLRGDLRPVEQGVEDAVDVLRDRALLRARRLGLLLEQRLERAEHLLGGNGDVLEFAGRELSVVADRGITDELADLLRVLRRDLPDELDEHPAGELARVLERWQSLLLGPVR